MKPGLQIDLDDCGADYPCICVLMYLFVQLSPGSKLTNMRHRTLIQHSASFLKQDPDTESS